MYGDLYRDMTHNEIIEYLENNWLHHYECYSTEFTLPNKKKPDIIATFGASVVIIEVKTLYKSSLIDSAIRKYAGYCNMLYIAMPMMETATAIQREAAAGSGFPRQPVGIIGVDWGCAAIVRAAPYMPRQPTVLPLGDLKNQHWH